MGKTKNKTKKSRVVNAIKNKDEKRYTDLVNNGEYFKYIGNKTKQEIADTILENDAGFAVSDFQNYGGAIFDQLIQNGYQTGKDNIVEQAYKCRGAGTLVINEAIKASDLDTIKQGSKHNTFTDWDVEGFVKTFSGKDILNILNIINPKQAYDNSIYGRVIKILAASGRADDLKQVLQYGQKESKFMQSAVLKLSSFWLNNIETTKECADIIIDFLLSIDQKKWKNKFDYAQAVQATIASGPPSINKLDTVFQSGFTQPFHRPHNDPWGDNMVGYKGSFGKTVSASMIANYPANKQKSVLEVIKKYEDNFNQKITGIASWMAKNNYKNALDYIIDNVPDEPRYDMIEWSIREKNWDTVRVGLEASGADTINMELPFLDGMPEDITKKAFSKIDYKKKQLSEWVKNNEFNKIDLVYSSLSEVNRGALVASLFSETYNPEKACSYSAGAKTNKRALFSLVQSITHTNPTSLQMFIDHMDLPNHEHWKEQLLVCLVNEANRADVKARTYLVPILDMLTGTDTLSIAHHGKKALKKAIELEEKKVSKLLRDRGELYDAYAALTI